MSPHITIEVCGVHPIENVPEPCHLIEVIISDSTSFDWSTVTQEVPGQPCSNWQVAYDEQPVDEAAGRWVFFFHYLDSSKPLLSPMGPLALPSATPIPDRLKHIQYHPP